MIRHYFEDEMRHLHEAGKAFAEVHPDQARYLNVDSLTDRDPYVERLFEGFAFLTARIRERLDDEMPQYTEGLLRLMYPHLVRPVPSMAILEFTPRPGMLQEPTTFAAGMEVHSRPAGPEGTTCRFTTVHDVVLQPFALTSARVQWPSAETSSAILQFAVDRDASVDALDLSALRLYLYAEPSDASRMHLFLTRHVREVVVRSGATTLLRTGADGVRPAGLAPEDELLPYGASSFSGYRLLQEYFCFRPKFWFVDLVGLGQIPAAAWPADAREFEVEIRFDRPYPEQRAFTEDNLRLFCTPIRNLFERDAEPIRVTHRASEYRVVADVRRPNSVSVYDVVEAVGTESATGRRHTYRPFLGFTHRASRDGRFYSESARIGPGGGRDTYVSLGGWGESIERLPEETLSLRIRCTNGDLPHDVLKERSIDRPAPGYPNVATFRNLTAPSREIQPPLDTHPDLYWRLISHLALNRTSVASVEALASTLRLYDWADTPATRRRIDGLRRVTWRPTETLHRGGIVRGAEVVVDVQDDHFPDDGDVALFGLVLSRFFAAYATINSFVSLRLVSSPSGRTLSWTPRTGDMPML